MSDFRFPGRWLNDRRVMGLSGDDFKAFVTAGVYMVENRTDGRLTVDDFDFIPRFHSAAAPRLVAAGVWTEDGGEYVMTDYLATQTSRSEFETLENNRRREREKKARQRASKALHPDIMSPGQSPGTAQDRTGQAGEDMQVTTTWPVAKIPDAGNWYQPEPGVWVEEGATREQGGTNG